MFLSKIKEKLRQTLSSAVYQYLRSTSKSAYRDAFRKQIHKPKLCIFLTVGSIVRVWIGIIKRLASIMESIMVNLQTNTLLTSKRVNTFIASLQNRASSRYFILCRSCSKLWKRELNFSTFSTKGFKRRQIYSVQ